MNQTGGTGENQTTMKLLRTGSPFHAEQDRDGTTADRRQVVVEVWQYRVDRVRGELQQNECDVHGSTLIE